MAMADSYKTRMDAINQLVSDQGKEKSERLNRESMSNWSEAFTNIGNAAHQPLTTAAHIMSGSRPQQRDPQKNIMATSMQRLNASSAQDILNRYQAADRKGQILKQYEDAKRAKEYQDAKLQLAQYKATQKPVNSKAFTMSPEERRYWKEDRGLTDHQLDIVLSGRGGRNPASTLNSMAERDEPSNQQINVLRDFEESELVLDKMVKALGDRSDWTGPVDGRIPDMMVGPDQVAWRSMVGRFNDLYRKAITGAGASNLEIKRLETRLPQPNDTYANFKAKASQMLEELKDKKQMYIEGLEKGGQYVDAFKTKGRAGEIDVPGSAPPSETAIAGDGAIDDYENLSDEELEKLMTERGLK